MSATPWSSLEPETRTSIEAQPETANPMVRQCGCQFTSDGARIYLCSYHDGFNDGCQAFDARCEAARIIGGESS